MSTKNPRAIAEATEDRLHPALRDALDAAKWLNEAIDSARSEFGSLRSVRVKIEAAREELRAALTSLDAFEAAVYPVCKPTPDGGALDGDRAGEIVG
jgi:hypothetical protein